MKENLTFFFLGGDFLGFVIKEDQTYRLQTTNTCDTRRTIYMYVESRYIKSLVYSFKNLVNSYCILIFFTDLKISSKTVEISHRSFSFSGVIVNVCD